MKLFILLTILFLSFNISAQSWEQSGEITFEVRQFEDDENADTFDNQRAIQIRYAGKGQFGANFFSFSFSGRYDDQDRGRNLIWPEDIYISRELTERLNVVGGFQVFNYSYMEAFHPLDVINAKIFDVSPLGNDKMGEMFVGFETRYREGDLKFYLLPHPTRPILPGRDSRFDFDINFHRSVWIGQDGKENDWSDHFILSWEKSFERFDLMVLTSKGMDRARLLIGTEYYTEFAGSVTPDSADLFTPFYYERFFSGINTVYNFDSFQLKSSIAHSYYLAEDDIYTLGGLTHPKDHSIIALGFEKPFNHNSGSDSVLIIEGQKIFAHKADEESFALQNDLFLAYKYSLNDINSTEIILATMLDLSTSKHEGFSQLSYARRVGDSWKFEILLIDYYIPSRSNINTFDLYKDKEHLAFKLKKYF